MTVRPTSLEAYDSVDIGARQREVLNAIRELGAATDKEIARFLGWEINRITPRRGELVAAGLVKERGVVEQNGRKAITWSVVPSPSKPALYVEPSGQMSLVGP